MHDDQVITVVLTYKNKILLLSPDIIVPKNAEQAFWGLIYGKRSQNSTDTAIVRHKVQYTTRLAVSEIRLIQDESTGHQCIYHVVLSDNEVNTMSRRSGQRLEFFEFDELSEMNLNPLTLRVLSQHPEIIQGLVS